MEEKQPHRRYSKQFKTDAVELVLRSDKELAPFTVTQDLEKILCFEPQVLTVSDHPEHYVA
ncbi:hypothetical protein [Prosthecochloris sp. SCSIO W1103]|uniref:hypothetical protein n=1 Tax=Prosthecochloris sp. SCSIO W1103 TaxID=2992244 RepID=UPI00223CF911|nr:hypothetical protein [Prosthecochloris sp. SCSIO W1103]UZJ38172.1 hypothetical protein OO005_02925 [Prosthecochloris sp. SCSIO W1103]